MPCMLYRYITYDYSSAVALDLTGVNARSISRMGLVSPIWSVFLLGCGADGVVSSGHRDKIIKSLSHRDDQVYRYIPL